MNSLIATINTKLLIVIIGLLITVIGIAAKYTYDQHQMTMLIQGQVAKQAAEENLSKAHDDAIRAELKRRSERSRSSEKSQFNFNSGLTK